MSEVKYEIMSDFGVKSKKCMGGCIKNEYELIDIYNDCLQTFDLFEELTNIKVNKEFTNKKQILNEMLFFI